MDGHNGMPSQLARKRAAREPKQENVDVQTLCLLMVVLVAMVIRGRKPLVTLNPALLMGDLHNGVDSVLAQNRAAKGSGHESEHAPIRCQHTVEQNVWGRRMRRRSVSSNVVLLFMVGCLNGQNLVVARSPVV